MEAIRDQRATCFHGEGTSLLGGGASQLNMEKARLCLVEMQEKGTWRRHVSVWWRCKKREHGEDTSLSGGDARKGNMEKARLCLVEMQEKGTWRRRLCMVDVRAKGTRRRPCSVDRMER